MRRPSQAARRCALRSRLDPSIPAPAAVICPRRASTIAAAATTGTTTSQNTHRHDHVVVIHAEMGGPRREGSTHAADTRLNTLGRSDSG